MADQNGNISLVWGENDAHYNLRNFWRFTSCNDDNFIQSLNNKTKIVEMTKETDPNIADQKVTQDSSVHLV